MKKFIILTLSLTLTTLAAGVATAATVWLNSLNLSVASQDWGRPQINKSVDGHALSIGGKKFDRGFGTHAESLLTIKLDGAAQTFSTSVGVDDEVNGNKAASVEFLVIGDGKTLWKSGVMHAGDAAKFCEVDLSGVRTLVLKVGDADDGIDFDHADWVTAKFESVGATTFATRSSVAMPPASYILTPPAPSIPRINGASVFGVRPGSPFLFTVPATGNRPITFSAKHLPAGLKLDSKTGHITGALKKEGEYLVILRAKNILGETGKPFRIVCGDQIALTPPMGWNSWNCFAPTVSADKVKTAADRMVKSGLINHGWTYINIDDYWQNNRDTQDPTLQGKFRDAHGNIVPNSRFPDMKGLADYVHGLGLKIGLYSSPGPWTCGGCEGSWKHEKQDAETYAKWGFDYLKYDWCSYADIASGSQASSTGIPQWGNASDEEVAKYPYSLMGKFLREQKRDIVFSLCQYGMADVAKWGGSVGGNCWRTTDDITDKWGLVRRGWSNKGAGPGGGMATIGFNQDKIASASKPGNWNDPDMLIVGQVGWGDSHPTHLTPDEQYTHISLWCLLAAPLLIGCDMKKFDDFTLSLLSNDEVLALDQDALGRQATCVITIGEVKVYEKELEDGGRAVGFFNLGDEPVKLDFNEFASISLDGEFHVRDLWRQQNLSNINTVGGMLPLMISAHGVVLCKFTAANLASFANKQ